MDAEEEEEDGTPLWKRALMKKRAARQKKRDLEMEQKASSYNYSSPLSEV